MWKMPQARLSFLIRATYDTLPSPSNLSQWYGSDESCHLCNAPNPSLQHILSSCKTALAQGRYRWRHDQVLRKLAEVLEVGGGEEVCECSYSKKNQSSVMATEECGETQTFDPNFKRPVDDRSCTDVPCCGFFILALLGYIVVTAVAGYQGDLWKLSHPRDSSGQKCGQIGTPLEKKPLLFFFDIKKCANEQVLKDLKCQTIQICVEKCPERFLTLKEAEQSKEDIQYYSQFCKERLNTTKMTPEDLDNEMCPKQIIPSLPIMNRCLLYLKKKIDISNITTFNLNATDLNEAKTKSDQAVEFQQEALRISEVFRKSWRSILLGLIIAMTLSLLFIFLLRYLAGVIIWTAVILAILVIGYATFQSYKWYVDLICQPSSNVTIKDLELQTDFPQTPSMWLTFTIILGIVELVILLLIIYLRKRISEVIALIKEASKALSHMTSLLLYPLLTFALLSLTFNSSKVRTQCPGAECLFAFYGGETFLHKHQIVFQSYNMFMLTWCMNFVTGLGQMTLAGAFASYYWTLKKPADIRLVFSSLGRALRYHTGSLAFGSLFDSFNQVTMVIPKCLEMLLKVTKYCVTKMKCLECCISSLDYCIKFLNNYSNINTYIMGGKGGQSGVLPVVSGKAADSYDCG
ncbi:hypothetical protein MHYP_G00355990 [Metynnis hypsauchen]